MKNIIIPTDFSVQSLSIVHNIIKDNAAEPVSIKALHMLHMPVDILDLMFLNKAKAYAQVPAFFNEALQALRNKYGRQLNINLEIIYGNNTRVLKNYFDNKPDARLYVLSDFSYNHGLKNSVNLKPMLAKCKLNIQHVLQDVNTTIHQPNALSALLVSDRDFVLYTQPSLEPAI